jgi:hypothetical protein
MRKKGIFFSIFLISMYLTINPAYTQNIQEVSGSQRKTPTGYVLESDILDVAEEEVATIVSVNNTSKAGFYIVDINNDMVVYNNWGGSADDITLDEGSYKVYPNLEKGEKEAKVTVSYILHPVEKGERCQKIEREN